MIVKYNFLNEIKKQNKLLEVNILNLLIEKLEEFCEMLDLFNQTEIYADVFYYAYIETEEFSLVDIEVILNMNRKSLTRLLIQFNEFIVAIINNYTEFSVLKKI